MLEPVAGILLIEDDSAARHLLRVLLERESHTVWESASPDEAWRVLAESAAPDLAIVDLRLGEASGIDLMRRVRADAIWATLPVVICSATPDRDSVLSSAQLGAAAFLTKPYDAVRIRAAVSKALGTRWVRAHFEDPASVTRRLSTDRDHIAHQAKAFFAELQSALKMVVETDEERKTALHHLAALRRTATELGLRTIDAALAQWESAGASDTAVPELLQRLPVLVRLFVALGV
jgi:two-component system chemotaxis response regulator CheY